MSSKPFPILKIGKGFIFFNAFFSSISEKSDGIIFFKRAFSSISAYPRIEFFNV
ncbi:hypothetical protein P872_23325 [Rhodonellum psychrophilum GCM71 = DSM 17998]|uniref:Uncharacterized protein n=1 Tax=Rhodonellum psychrophilum GCM71 = DSM 17998 TaxID=1123057 RepID=U5C4M3_9BACT|nr:hypothetical protein P872_23325 [Rhodonellum psychrophilum GCM71 = DSM 17998]